LNALTDQTSNKEFDCVTLNMQENQHPPHEISNGGETSDRSLLTQRGAGLQLQVVAAHEPEIVNSTAIGSPEPLQPMQSSPEAHANADHQEAELALQNVEVLETMKLSFKLFVTVFALGCLMIGTVVLRMPPYTSLSLPFAMGGYYIIIRIITCFRRSHK
jgi:hypothetical protein